MSKHRLRGLYRVTKRRSEKSQVKLLQDFGCPAYYEWEKREDLYLSLRNGDLVPVPRAACLGPSQAEQRKTVAAIMAKGADVFTIDTELHTGKNAMNITSILEQAHRQIIGDKRALSPEQARAYGKRSYKTKLADRTGAEFVAGPFWRDPKNHKWSIEVILSKPQMKGWSQSSAFRDLGPRGIFVPAKKPKR